MKMIHWNNNLQYNIKNFFFGQIFNFTFKIIQPLQRTCVNNFIKDIAPYKFR